MGRALLLMRHGRTEASAGRVYSGISDVPLTEEGRAQAQRAAARLSEEGIDMIRTSPLSRARDTAEVVAAATGAPLVVDDRLLEIDYGPIEGMDRERAERELGEVYTAWRRRPFDAQPPGMEPLEHALARVRAALQDLDSAERPLLVAHQGILRIVLIALGELDRDEYFSRRLPEAEPLEIAL